MHPFDGGSFFVVKSRSMFGATMHEVILLGTSKSKYDVCTSWFEHHDITWESRSDMLRIV